MSEKRFLNFIMLEGAILFILGLSVLILPKLTALSFGVMLSVAFIIYGIWKCINAIILRNYTHSLLGEILTGCFVFTTGLLLLFVPKISLFWLMAFIGIYFLIESLNSISFISHIKNNFNFWGCKYFTVIILALIGFLIIIGLPSISFWLTATLSGLGFVIKGMSKIAVSSSNKSYS